MRFYPFSELLVDDEFIFHYEYLDRLGLQGTTLFFKKVASKKYKNIITGCEHILSNSQSPHSIWVSKIVVKRV